MWQQVARGNIQHISYIPQHAFALQAHAAPSEKSNNYFCSLYESPMLHSPLTTCTCLYTVQELEPTAGTTPNAK